jgi:hypothetical protein
VALTRVRPYGSVSVYLPGSPRRRFLDLDRGGRVTLAIRRTAVGDVRDLWARNADASWVGVLAGGADHPLWGPSDRIVRAPALDHPPETLTACGAVRWDAIEAIPPLAEPARLPPGAGTTLLNVLASLAADQGAPALRYRGPFPTEQLFWALAECFRYDAGTPDPLDAFLHDAEAAFATGESREAPLDWIPAPYERLFHADGIYVQLRDGVEKVWWEGRAYYRPDWQGLSRREHRVLRPMAGPDGQPRHVAALEALGHRLEDHLVLDARGEVVGRPALDAPDPGPAADVPLPAIWREALAALLPLAATPLLAPAIAAVWPGFDVAWGPVRRDLVEARGERVRLSLALPGLYRTAGGGRRLARDLVGEVLALVGPAVRRAAAAWLDAEPPARQQALLEQAGRRDRTALAALTAAPLGRLLDALSAGEALPARVSGDLPARGGA